MALALRHETIEVGKGALSPMNGAIHLAELVSGLHGSVVVLDCDLRVVEVNEQWTREVRIPRESALGRSWYELVPSVRQYQGKRL